MALNYKQALLLLEDGTVFKGKSIGKTGTSGGELCFNTGMTGYQEIYTDPSYTGQIIINTTSHIGNYGVHTNESESEKATLSGLVLGHFSSVFSRADAQSSLQQFLETNEICGISEVDTRALVRHIRHTGAMNGIISSEVTEMEALKEKLNCIPAMSNLELSSKISTKEPYLFGDEKATLKVAVMDYGIKANILKSLASNGILCKVFPAKTRLEELLSFEPDGFFLSNGPGDPASMDYAIQTVKQMLETKKPVFGICLGHQLLASAIGIGTYKMKNGHRGLNHPVKNLQTGLSEITSQNHGFAVDKTQLEASPIAELTHINLNDQSVEGLRLKNQKAFSVQYHPEAAPGPHDSHYLFQDFAAMLG